MYKDRKPPGPLETPADALRSAWRELEHTDDLEGAATDFVPGHGYASGHHGEVLQGLFEGPDGRYHRALVTLPCDRLWSAASFVPLPESPLTVEPSWKVKALRAACLTLEHLGRPGGGRLSIRANIPPCWGMGSSTSDAIAASGRSAPPIAGGSSPSSSRPCPCRPRWLRTPPCSTTGRSSSRSARP